MTKKKLIPIIAVVVLLIGIGTSLLLFLNNRNSSVVTINGTEFSSKEIFTLSSERSIDEYSGVALDELMVDAGVSDPEGLEFTLIGSDGYQKTVFWENMQNGLLTPDLMSVFSDLPKAFMVKDIVEIEVE